MAAFLVLGNPERRTDFDRDNHPVSAPSVGVRVHRQPRPGADTPWVIAGLNVYGKQVRAFDDRAVLFALLVGTYARPLWAVVGQPDHQPGNDSQP